MLIGELFHKGEHRTTTTNNISLAVVFIIIDTAQEQVR